ncbi:DUF192 domain-containing protein [Halomarina rubra]|uniref:DUF192 domain-containing protein n=1 Tax=Halomarina rubra TaxID=2071873 RepID=A0ABD6AUM2_9EURY|nr:DUF192 domain-containing protein [Halomarina rubra]
MVRSTRTGALLLAVALVVALSGCAGIADDPATTETQAPATGTDAPPTATSPTEDASETATPSPASTADPTTSPTTTPTGPSATFVEDGETLATVTLEVADNRSERRRGLMHRESLAEDAGMVFVYDDANPRTFWMKNTLIPLDMVFVSSNGTVLNVEHADVPPEGSTDYGNYESDGPAQYVVEVNRGFANETGIGPGTQVEFSALNATSETETDSR